MDETFPSPEMGSKVLPFQRGAAEVGYCAYWDWEFGRRERLRALQASHSRH